MHDEIILHCRALGRKRMNSINEIAQLVAPISAEIVQELGKEFGPNILASVALLANWNPKSAIACLQQSKMVPTDGFLILANLSTDATEKQFLFARYLERFHLSEMQMSPKAISGAIVSRKNISPSRISVVVTAFNCGSYIADTVSSLINQTLPPLEIIVVDDASSDNTLEIINAMALRHPTVRVISLQSNVGTYAAKNIGINAAVGDFVTFQDADDWSHPQRLEYCCRVLTDKKNLVAVSCLYARIDENGRFVSRKVWPYTQWSPNTIFFNRKAVAHAGMLLDEVRFGADSEFVARLKVVFGENRHLKIRAPLMIALHRKNSLMTSDATGLDRDGISLARLEYQEMWSERLYERARNELLQNLQSR